MKFMKRLFLLLILCLSFSGCGDSISGKLKSLNKENVRKLAVLYKVYTDSHQFQGPKDEDELKSWAQGDPELKERFEKFGINVEDFDSYMTSRNGDKLEIRWGLKSRPMAAPYPVAFEPIALDGMRLVGMAGGPSREVTDDDEYDELWEGVVSESEQGEDANRGQ